MCGGGQGGVRVFASHEIVLFDLEVLGQRLAADTSVGRARALFREQATSWGLPPEVTDTAELLLSELMTNAYRHAKVPAGREIWARCVVTEDRIRVTVTDANDTLPTPGTASLEDESGRGLALVMALADNWGADRRECGIGKGVWYELALRIGP